MHHLLWSRVGAHPEIFTSGKTTVKLKKEKDRKGEKEEKEEEKKDDR